MADRSEPSFVGRERELAAMHAALAQVKAGQGRLLLVTGEPGVGKSALVDAFAWQARQDGARVLWGAAWEESGVPAYWPWVQVLRAAAPDLAEPEVGADGTAVRDSRDRAALGRLVPELARQPGAGSGGDGDRFALFDAVVGALERVGAVRSLVVVIEDLHAAGLPSALLLRFAAQHIRGVPVLLVATYREVEARLDPSLGEIVAALEGAGTVLPLAPMSPPEVRDLVGLVLPGAPDHLLAAIMERTHGNPLFVVQVARLLAQHTPEAAGPSEAVIPAGIPAGIAQAIRQRLARLASPGCRTALTVAAVLGSELDPGEVAAVLDIPVLELLEAIRPAVDVGLLIELGPQRYRFAHALVREAIYREIGSSERASWHHRVGTVLSQRSADGGSARLAHHFLASVPAGGAAEAVRYAAAAGREAMAALAYEEAAGHFQQALDRTAGDLPGQRCELLLSLGAALLKAADLGRAQPVLAQATEHARRSGNPELLGRAALLRAEHLDWNSIDHEAIDLLEEAASALDGADTPVLARVYAQLGIALQHGDQGRMAAAADRAVEVARRCGDQAALVIALSSRLHTRWGHHDPRAGLAEGEEVTRLAGQTGDPGLAATGHQWRCTFSLEVGDVAGARHSVARLQELADRSRQPILRLIAASRAATLAAVAGRFEDAIALADEACQIGVGAGLPDAEPVYAGQLFMIWRLAGLPVEHRTRMERIWHEMLARSVVRPVQETAAALIELSHGAREQAAARFEAVAAAVPELRRDEMHVWTLAMLAEVAVELGAEDHASPLYAALRPFEERFVVASGVQYLGSVHHYLSRLAALAGRPEDAARHHQAAARRHRQAGAAPMPSPAPPAGPVGEQQPVAEFRRSGRVWQVRWDGVSAVVADSKGMRDLAALLAAPGREVSVLDLVEAAGGPPAAAAGGHAGERLDRTARAAYRRRLSELEGELTEAEASMDTGQIEALRHERELIAAELAAAVGLGGRVRTERDPVERARTAVTTRIRTALKAIAEVSPGLARHLDRSVSTGRMCAYRPERPVRWRR